ncbi:hypothetical protein ABK040_005184 [Willaertia magna]
MLDNFTILTKGGLVLWSITNFKINGNPINEFIKSVFLEDRLSEKTFQYNNQYTLKWLPENEFDLIFIAISQITFHLTYSIDTLLEQVKNKFVANYRKVLLAVKSGKGPEGSTTNGNGTSLSEYDFESFSKDFNKILNKLEESAEEEKQLMKEGLLIKQYVKKDKDEKKDSPVINALGDREDQRVTALEKQSLEEETSPTDIKTPQRKFEKKKKQPNVKSPSTSTSKPSNTSNNTNNSSEEEEFDNLSKEEQRLANLEKVKKRFSAKSRTPTSLKKAGSSKNNPEEEAPLTFAPPKQKTKKELTNWDSVEMTYNKKKEQQLNKSSNSLKKSSEESEEEQLQHFREKFLPNPNQETNIDAAIGSDDSESEDEDYTNNNAPKKGFFSSFFHNLTNGKTLTKEDLVPIMEEFKQSLMKKNVAQEIAISICDSVCESLVGKKLGTFASVNNEVKKAMDEALTRILTPSRQINVLKEATSARDEGRPYVIVMCGVNGVGKSTTLSKICYWLLQKGFSCLIAACDTYRSGAVEQLQVHARCLNVPVFQKGYGKNAANVAKEAISHAKKNKFDIVLVDTAGRMQDNEPLMKSLIEVIHINNPDLVLFVGEALVGNDGIDQLQKFNSSLKTLSGTKEQKDLIDGIVLTKFDTIDDKVGAAVSMVHKTGHPIVFVGVGQTYTDLRTLKVDSVVKALLK